MDKLNPSPDHEKDSTNPKSLASEYQNSPPPTDTDDDDDEKEIVLMKTPEEVLAELSAGDAGGVDHGGSSVGFAMTVAGGSSVVIGGAGVGGVNEVVKKRKKTQLKDPPSGTPTCPECQRQFATWKAAFGHMRKHPERPHRGFFPPPAFNYSHHLQEEVVEEQTTQTNNNTSSTLTVTPIHHGDIGGVDMTKVESHVQTIIFNVNQQQEGDAGPSNAHEDDNIGDKKFNFDLNQPPPPEDDDDQDYIA